MSDNLDSLKNNHQEFSKGSLDTNEEKNPYVLFRRWFDEAIASEELEANACVISTVSVDLQPSARIVYLIRGTKASQRPLYPYNTNLFRIIIIYF